MISAFHRRPAALLACLASAVSSPLIAAQMPQNSAVSTTSASPGISAQAAPPYADIADLVIAPAGDVPPECAGPVDLLPLQVLAFETAMRRDKDPDAPVNLSKVVIL